MFITPGSARSLPARASKCPAPKRHDLRAFYSLCAETADLIRQGITPAVVGVWVLLLALFALRWALS